MAFGEGLAGEDLCPSLIQAHLEVARLRPHRDVKVSAAVVRLEPRRRDVSRQKAPLQQLLDGLPKGRNRDVRVCRDVRKAVLVDEVNGNGGEGELGGADAAAEERGEAVEDGIHVVVAQRAVVRREAFRPVRVNEGGRFAVEYERGKIAETLPIVEKGAGDAVKELDRGESVGLGNAGEDLLADSRL
ncbi:hypothetical protein BJY59DRAFT_698697 [Rhodotorula toruloides]